MMDDKLACVQDDFHLTSTLFTDDIKSESSSPLDHALLSDNDACHLCRSSLVSPRLLSCLHAFCELCLAKELMDEGGDAGCPTTTLTCPICEQETKVGVKKVSALPLDVMTTNISDVSNAPNLQCTSCTAKEKAVSRCSTCHNLLCTNCETAHRFMRLFETHIVVSIDELRKDGRSITVHKPVVCSQHMGEHVIYYCATCETPVCGECVKGEHNGHKYEQIVDAEQRVRDELQRQLDETKRTVDDLFKASMQLDGALEELANEKSAAKDLVNETFQSYRSMLEAHCCRMLEQINELYRERELKIMDQTQRVGRDSGLLEDACKYTARMLDVGSASEIMYLRSVVGAQLAYLKTKVSAQPQCTYSLRFVTEMGDFEAAVKKTFGSIVTEEMKMAETAMIAVPPLAVNGSQTTSSPISLPTSMQSSFDGDISSHLQGLSLAATPPIAMQGGFSSLAEFNIAQLASLADTSNSTTPPTQPFLDLFTTDTAFKNLQSLAQLGEHSMTNGANILMRTTSPALLNGFGTHGASPTQMLSTPDDLIPDGLSQGGRGPAVTRSGKVSPMQIRSKFGQLGAGKGQFNSPHGFCLGLEEDIVVADTNNHRVQIFDKTGSFKFQFGSAGKDEGQLWYPRKVAVMRASGKYVVCDRGNERSRMQIFTKNGHFLKKIAIRYIDIVAGLAVTSGGEIVAVDSVSPTVFVISENGELMRWFDCSDYMREPSDIAIHGKEFYVCDFKGHNVVVFNEDGNYLRRIGWDKITSYPNGIDISDAGDVLIGDSHGNRFHVAVFGREGELISEFECPYVKVSRCCGLKITSEGYIVTLAKNNHHVLVLNTLYIL